MREWGVGNGEWGVGKMLFGSFPVPIHLSIRLVPFVVKHLLTRWRKRGHSFLRESRQRLVAHRQIVYGGGDDDGRFLHVVFDDALVSVEIGVPGIVKVFNRVLAYSDAGQTGLIE